MVPRWVRGEETLMMLSPLQKSMSILGLGDTIGTQQYPGGVLRAEAVVCDSFEEMEKLGREKVCMLLLFSALNDSAEQLRDLRLSRRHEWRFDRSRLPSIFYRNVSLFPDLANTFFRFRRSREKSWFSTRRSGTLTRSRWSGTALLTSTANPGRRERQSTELSRCWCVPGQTSVFTRPTLALNSSVTQHRSRRPPSLPRTHASSPGIIRKVSQQ